MDVFDLGGRTAASVAAGNGYELVVAQINKLNATFNLQDENYESALWWASRYGRVRVVHQLLAILGDDNCFNVADCDG